MGIELIHHKVMHPFFGMGVDQVLDCRSKILFGTCITTLPMNLACPHIDGANQGLGSITFIFEFPGNGFLGAHGKIVGNTLKCLNTRHLIDTKHDLIGVFLRQFIGLANICNPLLLFFVCLGV